MTTSHPAPAAATYRAVEEAGERYLEAVGRRAAAYATMALADPFARPRLRACLRQRRSEELRAWDAYAAALLEFEGLGCLSTALALLRGVRERADAAIAGAVNELLRGDAALSGRGAR